MPSVDVSSPEYPDLTIPDGSPIMVPLTHGHGKGTTPQFAVTKREFTVHVGCIDAGSLVVKSKAFVKPQTIECNGTRHRIFALTDDKSAVVTVTADDSVRWSLTALFSDDPNRQRSEPLQRGQGREGRQRSTAPEPSGRSQVEKVR